MNEEGLVAAQVPEEHLKIGFKMRQLKARLERDLDAVNKTLALHDSLNDEQREAFEGVFGRVYL